MSLRTDAGTDKTFVADYTVFFWAWWLAWAPFMDCSLLEFLKVERQVIVGCVFGRRLPVGRGLFLVIAYETVQDGHKGLNALLGNAQTNGTAIDTPRAVGELLLAQPFSVAVMVIFFILSFILSPPHSTQLHSHSLLASEDLPPDGQPPRWHRLTWAFVLAGTALSPVFGRSRNSAGPPLWSGHPS